MSKLKLFLTSLILTTVVLVAIMYVNRSKLAARRPELVRIADDLYITSQLKSEGVRFLKNRGIQTIVDIRPDGEEKDQSSSAQIEAASKAGGIGFHYIPVPHENIPDSAVDALGHVLSQDERPAVLYCRTGRRAVRLFALAEASQADGPDTDAIVKMVREAGFSAEDLRDNIAQRISHRSGAHEVKN